MPKHRSAVALILAAMALAAYTGEEAARKSIASPAHKRCLKALQDGKLVILCVYGKNVSDDSPSLKAIRDFKADPKYATAEVVRLDPADKAESTFLERLEIDPKTDRTTLVVVPSNKIAGRITGPVTKDGLVKLLTPTRGCGPGCSTGCK